jgi:hypothetical protein
MHWVGLGLLAGVAGRVYRQGAAMSQRTSGPEGDLGLICTHSLMFARSLIRDFSTCRSSMLRCSYDLRYLSMLEFSVCLFASVNTYANM